MRIVNRQITDQAKRKYADCKKSINCWITECEKVIWNTTQDIKNKYRTASFLHNNIVIFNIKGNTYRLVIKVAYKNKTVYIIWFGTHEDYQKKDWEKADKGATDE